MRLGATASVLRHCGKNFPRSAANRRSTDGQSFGIWKFRFLIVLHVGLFIRLIENVITTGVVKGHRALLA